MQKTLSVLSFILCLLMAVHFMNFHRLLLYGEIGLLAYLTILTPWIGILLGSLLSLLTKSQGPILSLVAFSLALAGSKLTAFPVYLHPSVLFTVGIGWLMLVIKSRWRQDENLINACQGCGGEIPPLDVTCPQCRRTDSAIKITAEDFARFVGKNADRYRNTFEKFKSTAGRFRVSWHWPAFFVTLWWFLYRKLYRWALLIIALIPFVILAYPLLIFALPVACGMTANYIYYAAARKNIFELKVNMPKEADFIVRVGERGGVNTWVVYVGILFGVLLFAFSGFQYILQARP